MPDTSITDACQSDELGREAPQTLHTAMQHHLCRMLAHYTIYLGSKLRLPIDSNKEKLILEFAHSFWKKEGEYLIVNNDNDLGEDPWLNGYLGWVSYRAMSGMKVFSLSKSQNT